jgi:hypothetical protein
LPNYPITLQVDYTGNSDERIVPFVGLATSQTVGSPGGMTGIEIGRSSSSYSNSSIALLRNGVVLGQFSTPIQWTNASPIHLSVTINADGSMSGSAAQGGVSVPIATGAGALPSSLAYAILWDTSGLSSNVFRSTAPVLFDNFSACGSGSGTGVNLDGVVDTTSTVRGVSLLRDPITSGLVIVYEDTDDASRNNVRVARSVGGWSSSTVYTNAVVIKQGAGIDSAGHLHVALRQPGVTGLYYGTDRTGSWSSLSLIPGMPREAPTLDLDVAGAVHVTSNIHLSTRSYSNNAAGSWLATPVTVAGSATGPASIVAAGLGAPVLTYANWSGHIIYFAQGPTWAGQDNLYSYGVDQGPTQSLQTFGGAFHVAYMVTTDVYTHYTIFYQSRPSGGSWSTRTPLLEGYPAFAALDLAIGTDGTLYLASCDNVGAMRVSTNHGSGWVTTTPNVPYCAGDMDSTVHAGRLYFAYRGTSGRLTVASLATSSL